MVPQAPRADAARSPVSRRAIRVAIGAAVLVIAVAGTVVAQGPLQPDGSKPAPPVVEPEIIPQPDGSKPAPPVVEPEQLAQPANHEKQATGAPTQVSGPHEKAVGLDGQGGSSSKRRDTGGIDGADRAGGRTD
jgi:hypothetical protein